MRPKRSWPRVLAITEMAIRTLPPIALPLTTVALLLSLASLACESGKTAGQAELEALSELADLTTVTDLAAVWGDPEAPYYIEPMVRARIAEYVEAQIEAAESGIPATVPDRVPVVISNKSLNGDWDIGWEAIHEFLDSNGAVDFDEGQGLGRNIYIPFTLFPQLVEHPLFSKAVLSFGEDEEYAYPKLDSTLNNVVTALNGGVSPEQALTHAFYRHESKVLVHVITDYSDASLDAIRQFFTDNDVYMSSDELFFSALVPPSLIVPLSQNPWVINLETSTEWSPEFHEYLVWHLLPPDQRPPGDRPTLDGGN